MQNINQPDTFISVVSTSIAFIYVQSIFYSEKPHSEVYTELSICLAVSNIGLWVFEFQMYSSETVCPYNTVIKVSVGNKAKVRNKAKVKVMVKVLSDWLEKKLLHKQDTLCKYIKHTAVIHSYCIILYAPLYH